MNTAASQVAKLVGDWRVYLVLRSLSWVQVSPRVHTRKDFFLHKKMGVHYCVLFRDNMPWHAVAPPAAKPIPTACPGILCHAMGCRGDAMVCHMGGIMALPWRKSICVEPWVPGGIQDDTCDHSLLLWYALSPVASIWFVAIVPSSYLAGVNACFSDERLAPSFRRLWRGKQQL